MFPAETSQDKYSCDYYNNRHLQAQHEQQNSPVWEHKSKTVP